MNEDNQKGKPLNFSQATLGSKITIEKKLIEKYDIYAAKAKKTSKFAIFMSFILTSLSIKLFLNGNWVIGIITIILALISLFLFFMFRGVAIGGAFESGLLVPGMIVNTNPIEIVVLANISNSEDEQKKQYACKKTKVKLPLHQITLGEKVPCVAMFGGANNGIYTNFEPRPLVWACSSFEEITSEINRIDQSDWEYLDVVKNKVPKLEENQIALFNNNHEFTEVK